MATTHPLLRLLSIFDPRDGLAFVPPRVVGTIFRLALSAHPPGEDDAAPEERDPETLGRFLDGIRWLGRHYFRLRIDGVEQVPAAGPGLLVGNHSGGLIPLDWAHVMVAVWDRHGPGRAVYGLGHDFIQWIPEMRKYARRIGGLRAGHGTAEKVFARGDLLIVYPGSDFDSFRPFGERNRVVLAGRTGFVRLALRSQVPVLPVVTAGAQEQFIMLSRGEGIARLFDLKRRLRSNVFPIALSVPWGLTSGYLPYLPLPTQVSVSFCAPISWPHLGPEAADDEALVKRCYDEVEAAMSARMERLCRGRIPWLGQP